MSTLSLRDRATLAYRAFTSRAPSSRPDHESGMLPRDPNSVGGRLLGGVVQAGGQPPSRTVRELISGYNTMPWLRAVVARISFDSAAVEWQLYVKRKSKGKYIDANRKAVRDGHVKMLQRAPFEIRHGANGRGGAIKAAVDAGDLEPIENHQLLDLLASFNVFHTGLSGRRVTQQHLDLVGEAFWLIERDPRGMPIGIWPVPPNWILATPTVLRPFFRVSFRAWQVTIPATEFIWFSELDPLNPYARGSGTAGALADELETDEYASKHVKAFFFNRARPDLVVSPKSDDGSGMQDGEVRRLEEGWTQRSGGFWRAFKPFFVRRPVDIKELDQNLRSQQFVQLREFERNTCIQVYGVSPEILGIIAGGANRATINMAEYIYGRRVLVPRLELQRSVMQERLVPEFDERLILDYVSPVARDVEIELDAAKARPDVLTVDEWRARMGEPALPDDKGKELFFINPSLDRVKLDDLDLVLNPEPAPLPGDLPGGPTPPELPPAADPADDAAQETSWRRRLRA